MAELGMPATTTRTEQTVVDLEQLCKLQENNALQQWRYIGSADGPVVLSCMVAEELRPWACWFLTPS